MPRPRADILACLAMHVAQARREEIALNLKLDSGRFGETSARDPWPEHDAALCRDMARGAKRSWMAAIEQLLDLVAGGEPGAPTAEPEWWEKPAFSPEENERRRLNLFFPFGPSPRSQR